MEVGAFEECYSGKSVRKFFKNVFVVDQTLVLVKSGFLFELKIFKDLSCYFGEIHIAKKVVSFTIR